MNILVVGDVVGAGGCEFLKRHLPALKRTKNIDLCIVNGENSAVGNGMLPQSVDSIFASGATVITSGNHALRRKEIYPVLDEQEYLIRPANFHKSAPGRGYCVVDMGFCRVAVINLIGRVYMEQAENPFEELDRILELDEVRNCRIKIVDFHAEATAEKRALAFYADGRVSAIFGTHTHTQTADEQIFENGLGYITDVGMTGADRSVLGVVPELAIERMKTGLPVRFLTAEGDCRLDACVITVDDKSGKTTSIERITIR
ncbi:MAG: TIGR00282 family metallophosphoesterase [Clostridia bacterium]|nr:TIGR00282 family metallophosphoesterase [Clostridia bacterium]